jgi:penicillin-binding protein 1A
VRIVRSAFLLLLAVLLSVSALLAASALQWAQELPSLEGIDALDFTATSKIFASDGTEIGSIVPVFGEDRAGINRIPVGLDEVSPAALQAIIAYEDDQFFNHYGFDLPGIARAFYEEFFGEADRGGSTITTQVVKNTILLELSADRSLERKAKEVMLAIELERRLTKAEVLQRYVNVVYWGGNVYGIRAAAQAYFGKDPIELNLAEGLYLARLIPLPNSYHEEFVDSRESIRRVLNRMISKGMVSSDEAERAWLYRLQPKGWDVSYDRNGNVVSTERTGAEVIVQESVSSELSSHVVFAVRNWLTDRFGESVVFGTGGLNVYTTIDMQAQQAANAASERAEVPKDAQLAIVGIDPATGEVLAMVGEKLYPGVEAHEFNRATQARRQPGSSFKPIVYATAIEQGGLHQATILVDEETAFDQRGQEAYSPTNHDDEFIGVATVRQHLNLSRNIPAVKALEAATPQAVAQRALELGYSDVRPFFSLSLGSFEVTLIQHAAAFSAFANGGIKVEPHFIRRVVDADGNILYEANPRLTRVWSEQTAYIVLDLLHGNVMDVNPTAFSWRAAIDGRWVAGKTGTTNDEKDIWFVGITPGLVAAVWIGYDDPQPIPKSMVRNDGTRDAVNSSRQPIYAWTDFVENALLGRPSDPEGFPVPDGIVFRSFDRISGEASSQGIIGAFIEGIEPATTSVLNPITIEVVIDSRTGSQATLATAPEFIEVVEVRPGDIDQYLLPLPEIAIEP